MANDKDLSEREREILRLVATGASNKEIARALVISTNTVKVHLRNIFAKVGVVSRTEATLYAIRAGLVQVGQARAEAPPQGLAEEPEPPAQAIAPASEVAAAARASRRRRLATATLALVALLVLAAGALAVFWRQGVQNPPLPAATPQSSTAVGPDTAPSRWRERAPMPTARAGLAAAAYEGRIYAIAGEAAAGPTGAVERYDPAADSWVALSPKPLAVADVAAAVVGGRIYVPGGRLASGGVTSTLEVYDTARDTWEQRAPLPVAVSAYALAAFEGRLYLFGGWDGAGYVASVFEYDPRQDAWRGRTPMPTARGYAGAAVAGGRVYVLGGYDGREALAANEAYIPARDDGKENPWSPRVPLPAGRYGMGVISVADIVHVVGGKDRSGLARPAKYSPPQEEWQELPGPAEAMGYGMGLVGVETRTYTIGGRHEALSGLNLEYQALYTIVIPIR